MKKLVLYVLCLACMPFAFAQNNAKTLDDIGRITLSTYIDREMTELPSSAYNVLQNKLSNIVSQNGLGSSWGQQFIITANCNLLTKDITATTPPMHAYTLEVTLYVGDGYSGTLFASHSITCKGVGETPDKAYLAALKNIKTNNPEIAAFINEGKTKIIEYYNSQCDFILAKAKSQADMENYDEALSMLVYIPEVCKDCFMKAQSQVAEIYKSKINKECVTYLNKARASWMPRPNADDTRSAAMTASRYLMQINPYADCYDDALDLMKQVGKKMEEIDNREWEFVKTMEEHRHKEALSSIQATKEIEMAWAKNQPKTIYNIKGWW